jgi:hypothetical protein
MVVSLQPVEIDGVAAAEQSESSHATVAATERGRRHRYGACGSLTVNVVPSLVDELT